MRGACAVLLELNGGLVSPSRELVEAREKLMAAARGGLALKGRDGGARQSCPRTGICTCRSSPQFLLSQPLTGLLPGHS